MTLRAFHASAVVATPRYVPGQRVRVRAEWPEALQYQHIRTPSYVRGHVGVIERCFGSYPNPEDLAFARPAPQRFLYHVAFDRAAIWAVSQGLPVLPIPSGCPGGTGDGAAPASETTRTAPRDVVLIELYEHWLENGED